MSLTRFIALPDVAARIRPLRPQLSRKITEPLRVKPRSSHYALVGTAFDYLLRFELQRRAPHAVAERWVAESALDLLERDLDAISTWGGGCSVRGIEQFVDPHHDVVRRLRRSSLLSEAAKREIAVGVAAHKVAQRARRIIEGAKRAVAAYVKRKRPSATTQADLAGHAIRLARLDPVMRALRLDPQFEVVDPADVHDLLDMLALVPFDALLHPHEMRLNPTFGDASRLVGGADADLLTGDLLVDFKVTTAHEVPGRNLDQLLGYFLLARHRRRTTAQWPEINRLGLYFCRHGYFWVMEASVWTEHPQFLDIKEWFLQRAKGSADGRR
ncbi:MAG: hypothetical protein AB1563_06755 [Bacillota bacterium]|jgi:hypothetical protein